MTRESLLALPEVRQLLAEEREACARLVDPPAGERPPPDGYAPPGAAARLREVLARLIRSRA